MLVDVNWNPDKKQLRSFGLAAVVATVILAGYARLGKALAASWCLGILAIGLLVAASSILLPRLGKVFYRILIALTLPIGLCLSLVVLAVFYFLVITPMATLFRLVGRDTLCRRFDPQASTYWIQRKIEMERERFFQQF